MESPTDESTADDLVELVTVGDPALLAILRSVLDGAEIPYVVQGGEAMSMLPLPSMTTLTKHGLGAVILVAERDRDEASALLETTADLDAEEL